MMPMSISGRLLHCTILLFLIASMCNEARAEWVKLAMTEQATVVYVDPTTIRRSGKKVKMWSMLDFKTPQRVADVTFRSTKAQHEYDCKEDQFRMLSFSAHFDNLGLGNTLYVDSDPKPWAPVSPVSIESDLYGFACKR